MNRYFALEVMRKGVNGKKEAVILPGRWVGRVPTVKKNPLFPYEISPRSAPVKKVPDC